MEYLFSVPTTWKPFGVVDNFKEVVARAGFRQANSTIDFTEAEAAAVHTLVELNEPDLTKVNSLITAIPRKETNHGRNSN